MKAQSTAESPHEKHEGVCWPSWKRNPNVSGLPHQALSGDWWSHLVTANSNSGIRPHTNDDLPLATPNGIIASPARFLKSLQLKTKCVHLRQKW